MERTTDMQQYAWMLDYLWAALLVFTFLASWLMTVFTLPGNWVMVAAAIVYAWFIPAEAKVSIGWPVVIALFALASVGELLELLAGALGVAKGGGSKRAAVLAVTLSIPGAMLGAVAGSVIPIPVVGQLVGIIVFAGLGAMLGAVLGEYWKGNTPRESWQIGHAAFWGRIFGSVAKLMIASMMAAVGVIAVLWP